MRSSNGKRGSWEVGRRDREYAPKEKGRMERGNYQEDGNNINPASDWRNSSKKRDFNLSEQDYNQKNKPGRRQNAARDEGDEYDERRQNDEYNKRYRESVGGKEESNDDSERNWSNKWQPYPGVGGNPYISRSGRSGFGGKSTNK